MATGESEREIPGRAVRDERMPGEVRAFLALMRAHERLCGDLSCTLRSSGLSLPQYNVLRILRGAGPEGLPCRVISQRMVTRVPDITRLVDRLEEAGLARRERSKTDRRVVRVALTGKGAEVLAALDEPVLETHRRQFAGLAAEEVERLAELLERLLAGDEVPPCEAPPTCEDE